MGLIFTYGLTYGGALASLYNPFIGLLIYVAFAILRPEKLWFWSVPPGNYSRIVAFGLLAGWVIHGAGQFRIGRAKPIVFCLGLLLAWSALSAAIIATNKDQAWRFVEVFAKIVLPFLVGITTLDSLRRLKQLAWVILLCEGYLAFEFNQWYFGGYNRLWIEGFGDMDNNCNAIALTCCTGLGLFLSLGSPQRWLSRIIAFVLCLLMLHAVLFSFSRGGMLACLVMGAVSFFLVPKRLPHYLGFGLIVALGFFSAGPEVVARFSTITTDTTQMDSSAESRVVLWSACLDSMRQHPLGVGAGNWGETVVQYGFPRGKQAHTLWLQLGAELGVIGLVLLVAFYGMCIFKLLPLCREKTQLPDPWFRHLARGVVASLVGFAVSAQFVSLDLLEHPYYVTLIGAGILKLIGVTSTSWRSDGSRTEVGSLVLPSQPTIPFYRPRTLLRVAYVAHDAEQAISPLQFWMSLMSDDPVLYVSVKTPPSKLFVIKAKHAVVGEYELPLDTATWTAINAEGEVEVKDGKLVGKKAGQVLLKAVITFGDGTTRETPEMPVEVRHLVADAVWIEAAPRSSRKNSDSRVD